MSIYRKIGLVFVAFGLRTSLFIGLTLLGAVLVFTNSDTIKSSLQEVNAYDRFSQAVIDASLEQAKNDPNSIPLDDPKVAQIIKDSLNSADLENIAETSVDSVYAWLNGDTKKIELSIDVANNKEILAARSADYAIDRLLELETCQKVPEETNVFKLTCQPPFTDYQQLRSDIYKTLIEDDSIFVSNTLTEKNFLKINEEQSVSQVYPNAPRYFSLFKVLPYIILLLAAGLMVAMVFMSKSRLAGLHSVAVSLIGTGVILAMIPLLYIYLFPAFGISFPSFGGGGQTESFSQITNDLFDNIYIKFNSLLLNIAIQVATLGAILLLMSRYLKPKYVDYGSLSKKSGVSSSFKRTGTKNPAKSTSRPPIQTSEGHKRPRKSSSALEKRFKKLW